VLHDREAEHARIEALVDAARDARRDRAVLPDELTRSTALETAAVVGLLSPGETALAVTGAAAAHGAVPLPLLIASAWLAGIAGDAIAFWLGRRHGRGWLVRSGARIGVSADRLARMEDLVRRWGGPALVGGRFVGLVRALAPFLAGAAGLPARRAAAYSVLGAGAWCSALIVAGYAFAASLDSHLDVVGNVALGAAGAILLAGALRRRAAVPPRLLRRTTVRRLAARRGTVDCRASGGWHRPSVWTAPSPGRPRDAMLPA
jgi:membrane-associated protein